MTTRVIHIRHAPKGWEANPEYVYIGRAGKGFDGKYGNPIRKGIICPECNKIHRSAGSTLSCYQRWFCRKIKDKEFYQNILALSGKVLVCFCKPNPCHGDIIATYLNQVEGTELCQ